MRQVGSWAFHTLSEGLWKMLRRRMESVFKWMLSTHQDGMTFNWQITGNPLWINE